MRLVVVTGKGGVGKSAIAAALGTLLAGIGRRTILLEIDPRESLHHWLETPPSGGDLLTVGPGLFLQHLEPRHEMDDLVDHHLRIGPLVRRVLASPVYEHFADGAPGLKELAVLGHALRLVEGPPIKGAPPLDVVVLDAPASGHGVSLLTAPALAAEVIRQGPFGRMAARLSGLVADPARCAIVVVTQAEEMPAQEALELQDTLVARLGSSRRRSFRQRSLSAVARHPRRAAGTPEIEALWRTQRRSTSASSRGCARAGSARRSSCRCSRSIAAPN